MKENYNFYLPEDLMNESEKHYNIVSYATLLDRYAENRLMLNNLPEVDPSVWENMSVDLYDEEEDSYTDIYQWLACHLDEYDVKALNHFGVVTSYSDLLDCDVIAVTHFGTSWEAVATLAEPCNDFDKCYKPYED